MSDNENTTQDCCVCLEPAQTIAATPCNPLCYSDPLCETCFLKITCEAYFQATCPLSRTQWRPESESEPESEEDSAIDEVNYALYNTAESGNERLVRQSWSNRF